MGGSHSKQKGANWERTVCKRLSLWVSGMTREDIFWRSAMSGGRATFATRKDRKGRVDESVVSGQAGDISAISSEGEALLKVFLIECKNYAKLRLDTIVYGTIGEMGTCWEVPLDQAKQYKKEPLVIAKENFQNPIILLTESGYLKLASCVKDGFTLPVKAVFPEIGMQVITFRDLLGSVSYSKFQERN